MDTFAFQAVRLWHVCSREVRTFYRSLCGNPSGDTEYESNWFTLSKDGESREVPAPFFDSTTPYALQEVTRTRPDGRKDSRFAVLHRDKSRPLYAKADLFTPVPPPWLMIRQGDEDRTEDLAPYIAKGNLITLAFLQTAFFSLNNEPWHYVDPKTFEERQFPSSGILIQ